MPNVIKLGSSYRVVLTEGEKNRLNSYLQDAFQVLEPTDDDEFVISLLNELAEDQ